MGILHHEDVNYHFIIIRPKGLN